ncbi:ABC transporter permease [Paenibacillus sp. CMAA1364]
MKFIPILQKDLKVLLMDKGAMIVLFVLPIMFISVMSFALGSAFTSGSDEGVGMPVINHDGGAESIQFIEALRDAKGIQIITDLADSKIELTESKAKELVNNGDYAMALFIPEGFSDGLLYNKDIELISYEDPAQTSTSSIMSMAVEGVSQSFSVKHALSGIMDEQTKEILATMGEAKIKVKSTFHQVEQEILPDAFQQNVPGYTVMFAFFTVMFAGRSFIYERNEGTFRRILSAPVNKLNLFLGKMIPNYLIGLMQTVVMFGFGHFVFGMSLGDSPFGLIFISLSMIWASTTLGMLIASLVRTESQVTGLSVLIVLTLGALGGTMVPLFIMPDLMQTIALVTPQAWALSGYQDILVRGMGIGDVLDNILVLLGFGVFFISISIWRMRFDD